MSIVVVTGSAGLVGSEAAQYFASLGFDIVGIDNDMRRVFFGEQASTAWVRDRLLASLRNYSHYNLDIRDEEAIYNVFRRYSRDIALVIHTAAQPSHDWAAGDPKTDFTVNANGTSVLLEATRRFAPEAVFIFMSTNKVYGDTPNRLPLVERELRWEVPESHVFFERGIDETMSIDSSVHSLFGVSKVAADLLVQEYGRYFGMKTVCFRGGCLTGPNHSGAQLHGFLAYLMKCVVMGIPYTVFGYKGKQVRDSIHSADLIRAFHAFFQNPRCGEVYNMGGGRFSNCSILEAIELSEEITGSRLDWHYAEANRKGDHQWWISDYSRFQRHYPNWSPTYDIPAVLEDIYQGVRSRTIMAAAS